MPEQPITLEHAFAQLILVLAAQLPVIIGIMMLWAKGKTTEKELKRNTALTEENTENIHAVKTTVANMADSFSVDVPTPKKKK